MVQHPTLYQLSQPLCPVSWRAANSRPYGWSTTSDEGDPPHGSKKSHHIHSRCPAGSFTKAGQVLGCSQSTISFQIRQLEDELDFPLFERINRTVVLTDKGREVLAYAQQISKMTAELKHNLQSDNARAVRVRIAMADSLCNSLLEDNFQDFMRRNPGTSLKIVSGGTEEMFRLLDHNEVDAILTLESHIYNTEYVIVKEEQVENHFVVSAASPLAARKKISLADLVKQPFILTEKA